MSEFDEQLKQQVSDLHELVRLYQQAEKTNEDINISRMARDCMEQSVFPGEYMSRTMSIIEMEESVREIKEQIETLLTKHDLKI